MMLRFGRGVTGAADGPGAVLTELDPALPRRNLPLSRYNLATTLANRDDTDFIRWQQAATEQAHTLVTAEVEQVCRAGRLPIAIGGDHSLTFPLVRGVARANPHKKIGLIYIDAHLDMRPPESHAGVEGLISSGNSFRRLIETGLIAGRSMAAVGIYRSSSSVFKNMANFARTNGVTIIFDKACDTPEHVARQALQAAQTETDGIYLSVDIDVVKARAAPGVSAATDRGLPFEFVRALVAHIAGQARLFGVDVVEVSSRRKAWRQLFGQPFEEPATTRQAKLQQTARLAAQIIQSVWQISKD